MAKKILIADDEHHTVRILASRLRASSYEIIEAYDGSEALNRAREENPDLIIMDIRMPGRNGINVFEHLKTSSDTASIPVIIITGYPSSKIKEECIRMGARDFIAKPFSPFVLLGKVKRVLEETDSSTTAGMT